VHGVEVPFAREFALEAVLVRDAKFVEQEVEPLEIGLLGRSVGEQLSLGDVELRGENRELLKLVPSLGERHALGEATEIIVGRHDRVEHHAGARVDQQLLKPGGARGVEFAAADFCANLFQLRSGLGDERRHVNRHILRALENSDAGEQFRRRRFQRQ
jgi:hypothetical protein